MQDIPLVLAARLRRLRVAESHVELRHWIPPHRELVAAARHCLLVLHYKGVRTGAHWIRHTSRSNHGFAACTVPAVCWESQHFHRRQLRVQSPPEPLHRSSHSPVRLHNNSWNSPECCRRRAAAAAATSAAAAGVPPLAPAVDGRPAGQRHLLLNWQDWQRRR